MAARGDTGSFGHDNGRTVMDDLTCPVPWCQSSVCSEAADLVIAARDELPAGCANCTHVAEAPESLRFAVQSGECHLTPGARGLLALRSCGGQVRSIVAQLTEGGLVFLKPRTPRPLRSSSQRRLIPPIPLAPFGPTAEDKIAWIKLRVVDDQSGEPLPGVKLKVTLPNRKLFETATRADGAVEVHGIDPGTCDVASDLKDARLGDTYAFVTLGEQPSAVQTTEKAAETPDPSDAKTTGPPESEERSVSTSAVPISKEGVRIAQVEEHKVRTGESIKSLAEQNGLTWQELARFNWDTDVADEINVKLADEVGCTKKAPDGVNYRFDDSDDPGIVCIPKPWSAAGLATDRTHTFRVRTLRYTTGHWVEVCIVDEASKPIAGLELKLIRADGSRKPASTDAKGVARWVQLANEKVSVTFDDKEYVLEAEADAASEGMPATVAVTQTGSASGHAYDGHELDPDGTRRRAPEDD